MSVSFVFLHVGVKSATGLTDPDPQNAILPFITFPATAKWRLGRRVGTIEALKGYVMFYSYFYKQVQGVIKPLVLKEEINDNLVSSYLFGRVKTWNF